MNRKFEIEIDQANHIIINKISGYTSLEEYKAWEQEFLALWHKHFQDRKIKILSDHRGYRTSKPEIIEHAIHLRERTKGRVIAGALVVDTAIEKLQLQRMARESEMEGREKIFTNFDEALQWLKDQ